MKIVVQIIAFVVGTFVFIAIFSDSNAVTYADLIVAGAVGGGIAWGVVGRLFKDEPVPESQRKDD
jgi:hypothetical protein